MNKTYQQTFLVLIYLIALVAVTLFSFVLYFQMQQVKKANEWVIHSHKVIEELYSVTSDINFAESKLRAYFVTGDLEFYNGYAGLKEDIFKDIFLIKTLTADSPLAQEKLDKLAALLQSRFKIGEYVMSMRRAHSLEYALKYIQDKKYIMLSGRVLSQQVLDSIQTLIFDEKSRLEKRNFFAINYFSNMSLLAICGNIVSAFLMMVCFLLLNRELLSRFVAEKKLRQSESELKSLAFVDSLTGLANRTVLLSDIGDAILAAAREGRMVGLVFIDIDNFKNINDSFGHSVGDGLLKFFAINLQKICDEQHKLFRLSGDEFAIILQDIYQETKIISFLEKVLEVTRQPVVINSYQLFITCSMGVSFYPGDGEDAKSLLKNADIAMYRAKKMGKNNYQFCMPELTSEVEERAKLEQKLHRAVQQKEFILFYQPKISLETGEITGFEALIRWKMPNGDLVSPTRFITLAESNGLIVQIGEWLLRTVCTQGKKWLDEGIPLSSLAVNVSIRELNTPDFVLRLERILQETGFDPRLLELEITETILMNNSERNLSILRALKYMGIKITIDDFGTGYSSLSYLHLFSIDKIKIDQSFVKEISDESHNPIIINAIISMAHSLKMKVVAEGVETLTQFNFLKKHNCDEIQGFYCSYPLAAEEVRDFFNKDIDYFEK